MFVRVKDKNGTEALVTQAAFDAVWKDKGFTLVSANKLLVDADLAVDESKPKPKGKATK